MNTSTFLTALRANASLPLVFRAGRELLSPGYHLTEVKRVSYETMDCGAMTHRWAESQFELWAPAGEKPEPGRAHMVAQKFLAIIDRVAAEVSLNGDATARIHASFAGGPAALYEIAALTPQGGQLVADLSPDRTRCKAAERRASSSAEGACCGTAADAAEGDQESAGCGCATPQRETAGAVCCG